MTAIIIPKKPMTVQQYLNGPEFAQTVESIKPPFLNLKRLVGLASGLTERNSKIAACDPYSVAGAILQAVELGLEPGDSILGQAYFIPFGKEDKLTKKTSYRCQFIPGYKGLVSISCRHGNMTFLDARIVYENDDFQYHYGTPGKLKHIPTFEEQGRMLGAYAIGYLNNKAMPFTVMSLADIYAIRNKSKGYIYNKFSSHWAINEKPMIRKTPIRNLLTNGQVPITIEMSRATFLEDQADSGEQRNREYYMDVANLKESDIPHEEEFHTLAQAEVLDQLQNN